MCIRETIRPAPCVLIEAGSRQGGDRFVGAYITAMTIFLIIILSAFIIWNITQLWQINIKGRTPWFPTPSKASDIICDRIKLLPGETFAEIGAGSGRISMEIARRHPDNQIYAYEIAYVPFTIGWLNALKYPNVHFIRADFRDVDLNGINYFYSFLNKAGTAALVQTLDQLQKPAKLYSLAFRDTKHQLLETIPAGRQFIYLYQL